MDKLKLRYLIREAIENVAGISAKFSVGDKVTTVEGDTATVTMAEHPFYTVELESTGTTKSFNFKDIAPFQEKEIAKTSEGISLQEGVNASPGLESHQTHKKPLSECVFRIGSDAYVEFFAEARELFNEGALKLNELDRDLIKRTDIGGYGLFEDKNVPLDIPFINEDLARGYNWPASKATQDRKDMGYDLNDLLAVKSDLKKKGFNVKVGYPTKIDHKIQIQHIGGDIDDLQLTLDQMFGDNYRIVFDTNQRMFEESNLNEYSEYGGREVKLNKPKRGGSKAYYVYVKDPRTKKVKKVQFGSGGLRAKIKDKDARSAYAARHRCSKKKDRTTPGYWSCNLPRYAKALKLGNNINTFW